MYLSIAMAPKQTIAKNKAAPKTSAKVQKPLKVNDFFETVHIVSDFYIYFFYVYILFST